MVNGTQELTRAIPDDVDAQGRTLARLPGAIATGRITVNALGEYREPGVCLIVNENTATADGMWLRATPVGMLDELMNDAAFFNYIASDTGAILERTTDGLRISPQAFGLGFGGGGAQQVVLAPRTLPSEPNVVDSDTIIVETAAGVRSTTRGEFLAGIVGTTDLGTNYFANRVEITSSSGQNTDIVVASATEAGMQSPGHYQRIEGTISRWITNTYLDDVCVEDRNLAPSAQTNITVSQDATSALIASSTGTNDSISLANTSTAGLQSPNDWDKVNSQLANWVTSFEIAPNAVGAVELDDTLTASLLTDLAVDRTTTTVTILNSTGDPAVLPAVDDAGAGIVTVAQRNAWNSAIDSEAVLDISGNDLIDASSKTVFTLNLTGDATPNITLPQTSKKLLFIVITNGFTFGFDNWPMQTNGFYPEITDAEPNPFTLISAAGGLWKEKGFV